LQNAAKSQTRDLKWDSDGPPTIWERPIDGNVALLKIQSGYSLEPPATSPKKQEKNYQQQDEGEAATAVIAEARAHVIAAAAEEQQ
jgi:hypothetical protein